MAVNEIFNLYDKVIHTPTNDEGIIVKINYDQYMTVVMRYECGKTREHSVWQFRKIEDNSINKCTEYDSLMVKNLVDLQLRSEADAEPEAEAKNKKINDNHIYIIMKLLNNSLNTDFYECVKEFKKEIEPILNENDAKRVKKIFNNVFLIEEKNNIGEHIKKLDLLLSNELITIDQILGHYRHKIIEFDMLKLILSRSKIDQEFGNLFKPLVI
jgi:hypothetical protein